MARACGKCGQTEHHVPDCPEMFWPDGFPRGFLRPGAIEPPPAPDPAHRHPNPTLAARGYMDPRYMENPGGLSPIGIEFAKIFSTLPPKAVLADEDAS